MQKMFFSQGKFGKWMIFLAIAGLLTTVYLVVVELIQGDYCPEYPLIRIPACYLVLLYFGLVVTALFIKNIRLARIMYYSGTIAGLVTATWFSASHLLGTSQCPIIIGIPLCFVAFLTFGALLILYHSRS